MKPKFILLLILLGRDKKNKMLLYEDILNVGVQKTAFGFNDPRTGIINICENLCDIALGESHG